MRRGKYRLNLLRIDFFLGLSFMSVNVVELETSTLLLNDSSESSSSSTWRSLLFSRSFVFWAVYVLSLVLYTLTGKRQSTLAADFVWTLMMLEPLMLVPTLLAIQLFRIVFLKFRLFLKPSSFLRSCACGGLIFVYITCQKYGARGDLISGPILVLLSQIGLMIVFVLSIVLGRRFSFWQFLGAGLVISAVALSLIPDFLSGKIAANWVALIVIICSYFPLSISQMTAERLMQTDLSMDFVNLLLIVVVVHCILNVPALYLIPVFLDEVPYNVSVILENVNNGIVCVFVGSPSDPCHDVFYWTMAFYVSSILAGLLSILVQKHISAAAASLAITSSIPLAALMFLIPLFGGAEFSWFLIGSLLLMVPGVVLFRLFPPKEEKVAIKELS